MLEVPWAGQPAMTHGEAMAPSCTIPQGGTLNSQMTRKTGSRRPAQTCAATLRRTLLSHVIKGDHEPKLRLLNWTGKREARNAQTMLWTVRSCIASGRYCQTHLERGPRLPSYRVCCQGCAVSAVVCRNPVGRCEAHLAVAHGGERRILCFSSWCHLGL